MMDSTEARKDLGRARLPVDRCFTVAGFGTVVTGTLIDGSLSLGQEVQLVLSGESGRIRGLQTHMKKLDHADPGRRLAVNLSGIARSEIQRGEVITTSGWLRPTGRLDAHIKLVPDAREPSTTTRPSPFTFTPARPRPGCGFWIRKNLVQGKRAGPSYTSNTPYQQ